MNYSQPTEQIIEYIRPHWIKKIQASLWYAVLLIVPVWLVRVFNESIYASFVSYSTLVNGVILYVLLWLIGLGVMALRKRDVQAFLTNTRLIAGQGARRYAIDYPEIQKAVIWYPTKFARAMRLGSLTLSMRDEEIRINDVYDPEALVRMITEIGGVETSAQDIESVMPISPPLTQLDAPAQNINIETRASEDFREFIETPELILESKPVDDSIAWVVPEFNESIAAPRASTSLQLDSSLDNAIEMHEGEAVYF